MEGVIDQISLQIIKPIKHIFIRHLKKYREVYMLTFSRYTLRWSVGIYVGIESPNNLQR